MNPRKFLVWATTLVGVVLAVNAQPSPRSVDDYDDIEIIVAGRYPQVSWVSPADGATYATPINATNKIALTADASSRKSTISQVQFVYSPNCQRTDLTCAAETVLGIASLSTGTNKVGRYGFDWTNALPGTHRIRARASDAAGGVSFTQFVYITVTNTPPVVTITSPAVTSGKTYALVQGPSASGIPFSATATDGDGLQAGSLKLYKDSGQVGTSASASPFSTTLATLSPGIYVLSAVATDSLGSTTTATRTLKVNNQPQGSVSLNVPTGVNHVTAGSNLAVTIIASPTDTDGAITQVEFLQDDAVVAGCTKTAAPFTCAVSLPARVAAYSLTARATDNDSGVTTYTAISVTVNAKPVLTAFTLWQGATQLTPNPVGSINYFLTGSQAANALTLKATANDTADTGSVVSYTFSKDGTAIVGCTAIATASCNLPALPGSVTAYNFTVSVTDNRGGVTSSANPGLTLNINDLPSVAITAPAVSATITAFPYTLTATASDPQLNLVAVEFWAQLGTGTPVLIASVTPSQSGANNATATWACPANTTTTAKYTIYAIAKDVSGGTTQSASITNVSVNNTGLQNCSFEEPSLTTTPFSCIGAACTSAVWTFNANSGIVGNGAAATYCSSTNTLQGTQAGLLRGDPTTKGKVSQTINFPTTGTYRLDFRALRNAVAAQNLVVRVAGAQVGTLIPIAVPVTGTPNTYPAVQSSATFPIATAGTALIEFETQGTATTQLMCIDDIRVVKVPSPPAVSLAITGLTAAQLSGGYYTASQTATLTATATDLDGGATISALTVVSRLSGTDTLVTAAPFSGTCTRVNAGNTATLTCTGAQIAGRFDTYSFFAKATDATPTSIESTAVAVQVDRPPTVNTLTLSKTTLRQGESLNITFTPTDLDGDSLSATASCSMAGNLNSVAVPVPALTNGQLATASWNVLSTQPVGTYTCTVTVSDGRLPQSATSAASAAISVTVNNGPTVTLTSPVANQTFAANASGALVTLTATVNNTDLDTTSLVAFEYQGGGIASWTTVPYTSAPALSTGTTTSGTWGATWLAQLSADTVYSFRACATDNYGIKTCTAGVNATVAKRLNFAPTISNAIVSTTATGSVKISVTASDPDNNTLTVSAPSAGSCSIVGNGSCDLTIASPTVGVNAVVVTVSDGSGGVVTTTVMVAGNATPSTALTDLTPDGSIGNAAVSTVGTTAGTFAVGEGGAASYSIPIQVPPGVNGVQPNLALSYSSQGGDGFVGVGWSLSGVSSIARCPKNYAQDTTKEGVNYDELNNDVYCLDGQRLVPVTTGDPTLVIVEYRTEVDSYSRIRSEPWPAPPSGQLVTPGPLFWTVVTKGGQTMRFGTRQQVYSRGYGQTTNRRNSLKTWLLSEVRDSFSNVMLLDYAGSNVDTLINIAPITAQAARVSPEAVGAFPYVEYWPSRITYHGSSYDSLTPLVPAQVSQVGSVTFEVECRDGTAVAANGCPASELTYFDSGAGETRSSRRLKRIAVSAFDAGTEVDVRNYTINYSASQASTRPLVQSIQECTGNTQSTCLPSTNFSWSSTTVNTKQFVEWGANTGTEVVDFLNTKIADFNGDGKSDYFRHLGGMSWEQCLSTGTGFACSTITLNTAGLIIESDPGQPPRFFANDMNGDGYADITMFYGTGPFLYRFAFTCNGGPSGIIPSSCTSREIVSQNSCTVDSFCDAANAVQIADLDGDGIMDLMIVAGVNGVGNALKHCFPNAAQTQYICGTNAEFGNPGIANSWDFVKRHMMVGDFDGDGKVDVIRRYADSDTNDQWRTFLSDFNRSSTTGTTSGSFVPIRAGVSPINKAYITATGNKIDKLTVMDFNGDGLADMASQSTGNNWLVCLSTGDGSFQLQDPTLNWSPPYLAWVNASQNACYATNASTTIPDPTDPLNASKNISCQHVDAAPRCRLWATTNRAFDKIIWGDFNGDGRTDQATFLSSNTLQVCLSRGNQFGGGFAGNACETWTIPANLSSLYSNWDGAVGMSIVSGDFDGDGRTDIAIVDGNNKMRVLKASTNVQPVDVISQITTGLGATTGITYKPITDSSVYSSTGTPAAGEMKLQSPMFVVKSTDASNGQGGYFTTSYFYDDLRAATNGRGMLGFGKRRMIDSLGIVTESTYNNTVGTGNAWAIAGRPVKSTKWVPTSTSYTTPDISTSPEASAYPGYQLVNRVTSAWAVRASAAGHVGVVETHGTSTVDETWELDAANFNVSRPLTRNTTSSAFGTNIDSYGNVVSVTTKAEQEFNASGVAPLTATYTKTTNNTYLAASVSALGDTPFTWIVGRLKDTTVSHAGGTGNITRKSAFTYAGIGTPSGTCSTIAGVLCTEEVEPDRAALTDAARDLYVKTDYGYDSFGNRTSSTTRFYDRDLTGTLGTSLTARSSTSTYGYGGRFPVSVKNAFNDEEKRNYDIRFGGTTKTLGPNKLLSETIYDGFGRKVRERSYTGYIDSAGLLSGSGSTVSDAVWNTTASSDCGTGGSYTITRTVSGGPQSQVTYDSLQRELCSRAINFAAATTPATGWSTATTSYDTYGRKTTTTKPAATGTLTSRVEYDSLSRPVCEYSSSGALPSSCATATASVTGGTSTKATTSYQGLTTSTTVYGAKGGVTTSNNSLTTSRVKNSQGWVTSATDANGQVTTYRYNGIGNLTGVTAPGNGSNYVESFTYDARGRKIGMSSPDAGSGWIYRYNGAGELSEQVDARGFVSRSVFDALGRTTERREYENDGTGSYFRTSTSYDSCTMGRGKACTVTSGYDTAVRTRSDVRYDALGRSSSSTTVIDGKSFSSATAYDALGRAYEQGAPGGLVFTTSYQTTGGQYATTVKQKDTQVTHWQAGTRNADGSIATMTVGGLTTSKTYDGQGRINGIATGTGGVVQNGTFGFDALGNLTSRGDTSNGIASAGFTYDALNRLTDWTADFAGGTGSARYDVAGNIVWKSGVAGCSGTASATTPCLTYVSGTHRLLTANGVSYGYEGGNAAGVGDGNVSTIGDKTLNGYTAFNLPTSATNGAARLDWLYDAGHSRIREVSSAHGTTYFIGGYERVERDRTTVALADSTTAYTGCLEERTYIGTPEGTVGVVTRRAGCTSNSSGALGDPAYWHKDHIGSIVASTNAAGTVTARFRFDPWGARQCATLDGAGAATGWIACNAVTNEERGFTGHEMLDELGLVHMNGRLYDQTVGRFMQADPVIQDAYNAQNYNRYSYVMNNPLSYTDPTGFSWWTKWRKPIFALAAAIVVPWAVGELMMAAVGTGEVSMFAFGSIGSEAAALSATGKAVAAAAGGFAAGGISGGNLQSAVQGAVTAALTFGVGEISGAHSAGSVSNMSAAQRIGQIAGHAAIGCASHAAAGGSCKAGAMSAGFSTLVGPHLPGGGAEGFHAGNFLSRMAVGAIASKLGGGKYESGAMSAAFEYLYNQVAVRLNQYKNLSFDEDRKFRALERKLLDDIEVFATRAKTECPGCREPLSNWEVSVDPNFAVRGIPASTKGNATIFGKFYFRDVLDERLDTVAHEFRHTMPENQRMISNSCIVNANCSMEQDAVRWAKEFWRVKK